MKKTKKDKMVDEILQRKDLQNCSEEFRIWIIELMEDVIDHYETIKTEELWNEKAEELMLKHLKKDLH